jgi:hypothetical protein
MDTDEHGFYKQRGPRQKNGVRKIGITVVGQQLRLGRVLAGAGVGTEGR